ncbi:DNA adenine methylase [Marinobacterium sedimentorum]|uniref:DNA adenine methylase n=1 Tax=Marinobacterium sedimentorum TaxID=2927804 RepID=UPI0020C6F4D2|nr:DNA adenine methylase [Marinobacterium sedimentorum]MCP8687754.1 DNA adenine methylase [Marinobacterium sedimentorum]
MSKPLVPWIGGKRKLAKHLIPLFPDHNCYCEPFAGAAALFFMKPPARSEVLNDLNGDIINLYRVVQHHPDELYRQFRWTLSSRQHWQQLSATPVAVLTDVQRAARFIYLQKQAFGGKVTGQSFGVDVTRGPRFNAFNIEQSLSDAHFRLASTTIEHLDWLKCMHKYDRPGTLFYCDPPYWQTEGYGIDFPFGEYEKLAAFARNSKGRVIISLNDHPDIRGVMQGLEIHRVDYAYTLAAKATKKAGELIIRNF